MAPPRSPEAPEVARFSLGRQFPWRPPCYQPAGRIAYLRQLPSPLDGEAKEVLVLSRKPGERILIGDKITVTVVKIGHGGVRIGIDAPAELAVVRQELADELQRAEAMAAEQADSLAD